MPGETSGNLKFPMNPASCTINSLGLPGPKSKALLDEMSYYVKTGPQPFALDLAACHGMFLVTVDGQELFDWTGYYGSKLIGHNHPRMQEPAYVRRLVLAANNKTANPDFLTAECVDFYRFLHENTPLSMRQPELEVYAVNSGAEAVENMMKFMISKFNTKRAKQRKFSPNRRFLYFDKAFHGRTVFALGVTQTIDTVATKDFEGLTAGGNIKLPFPSVGSDHSIADQIKITEDALRMIEMALSQMSNEIVGILVEPIQGAGGQRCARPEFFVGLADLAHRYDVYVGYDEVQTAGGATGKMFAIDHFDLPHPPIAVASGKKFGTGVLWMLESLEEQGVLDSTWGGTLADMVRVVHEMKIVREENLIEEAARKGEILRLGLLQLANDFPKVIHNVRGMGLYQGFQLHSTEQKARFIQRARDEFGLLLLGAGFLSIRLRPNLGVTDAEIEQLLATLRELAASD